MATLEALHASHTSRAARTSPQKPLMDAPKPPTATLLPFQYLSTVDTAALSQRCQEQFGVTPRAFQLEAASAVLMGKDCVVNVPTGGGKTLAFYLPLLLKPDSVILVVSPLTALMMDQVHSVNEKMIDAAAVCAELLKLDPGLLTAVGSGKIPLVFVSPELATSSRFNLMALQNTELKLKLLCIVIDEAHCISEWGGTFRPDYELLGLLRGRVRPGTAVMLASATLPIDINKDIRKKLRISPDAVTIEMSNDRPNIALSVRVIKHPEATFADLACLIPPRTMRCTDIPPTLAYFNTRLETEDAADQLRLMLPEGITEDAVAFYHAKVGDVRKADIVKELREGSIRVVCCTDAVGMGCDIPKISTVVLWKAAPTFCSLIQRIGRCARDLSMCGEAIIFVAKSVVKAAGDVDAELAQQQPINTANVPAGEDEEDTEEGLGAGLERIDANELGIRIEDAPEEEPTTQTHPNYRKRKRPNMNIVEERDSKFLTCFLCTKNCRRQVWSEYFDNGSKVHLDVPTPPGMRDCDNCTPDLFPLPNIVLTNKPREIKRGARRKLRNEHALTVRQKLDDWREEVFKEYYSDMQFTFTPQCILSDDHLTTLSEFGFPLNSISDIADHIRWGNLPRFGQSLLECFRDIYTTITFDDDHLMPLKKRQKRVHNPSIPSEPLPAQLPQQLLIRIPRNTWKQAVNNMALNGIQPHNLL